MIIVFLLSFLVTTQASECPLKAPSKLLEALDIQPNDSMDVKIQKTEIAYSELHQYVDTLTTEYLQQRISPDSIHHCLQQNLHFTVNLEARFSKSLFTRTLQKLRSSKSITTQFIATTIDEKDMVMFQLFGREIPGSARRAEVDRTTGIFSASLALIDPAEWPLLFLHEILHRKDQTLQSSIITFNNTDSMERMVRILKTHLHWRDVSKQDQIFMLAQIERGLNRGFLAEFRSWTYTFIVYKEWLELGEIKNIAWADEVLSHQHPQEFMTDFIYRFLRSRFYEPNLEGIYDNEVWRNAYALKLKELDQSNKENLLKIAYPDLTKYLIKKL